MGQRFRTGSSSNLGNRNHELWFESCLATHGGIFFPECPVTPSEPVICSAASLELGVRGTGRLLESYFKKQMCFNPHCSKLQDRISQTLSPAPPPQPRPNTSPPPAPARRPNPAARRATLKRTYAPSSAQMQWGENPKAKSERRAVPVPAWKGSDCWGSASRLAAPRILAISLPGLPSSMPQSSWGRCPDPSYLRRSRARPRFARLNLNPCRRLASTAARPSPGSPGPASGLGQPRRTPAGRCAAAAVGGGSEEASAARSPLPAPAGRCLCARRARGGGWGAPGEPGGGRGGASWEEQERPAPAGSRLGLNTRGRRRSSTRDPQPWTCGARLGRASWRGRAPSLAGGQVWRILK